MKTIYKVLMTFIVGICLIFVGISIGGLNEISDISLIQDLNLSFHSKNIKDQQESYPLDITTLKIKTSVAKITISEHHQQSIDVSVQNIYDGFEIEKEGNTLYIKQPHYWLSDQTNDQAIINITVPEGYQFDYAEIINNIGKTECNELSAKEVYIENSLGKLTIDSINSSNISVDNSLGKISLSHLICNEILDLDCGMGSIDTKLIGKHHDFSYNIDVGMGSVQINNEDYSDYLESHHSQHHSSQKTINVDCGMGSVNIEMED